MRLRSATRLNSSFAIQSKIIMSTDSPYCCSRALVHDSRGSRAVAIIHIIFSFSFPPHSSASSWILCTLLDIFFRSCAWARFWVAMCSTSDLHHVCMHAETRLCKMTSSLYKILLKNFMSSVFLPPLPRWSINTGVICCWNAHMRISDYPDHNN